MVTGAGAIPYHSADECFSYFIALTRRLALALVG